MPSPHYRFRVLYVGRNHALSAVLQDTLADLDCLVVYCPPHGVPEARLFIGSAIPYAVFLFDDLLHGTTGAELARFALSLPHRARTPVFAVKESDDLRTLAERVRHLLCTGD